MFSWLDFLQSKSIEFAERGPSVTKDHVAIRCPFCGDADPSTHMSLNLVHGAWRCFRNPTEHCGRSPVRLIQKLLNCSWQEARELGGVDTADQPVAVDLTDLRNRLVGKKRTSGPQEVRYPDEFFALDGDPLAGSKRRFLEYLAGRGFEKPLVVSRSYALQGALTGGFAHRVVLPLERQDDDGVTRLYGWTGRAITKEARLRYLTFGETRDLLWEPPRLREGGKLLVVTEGPVDAMKTDVYGRELGARAVALLGLDPSEGRLARLASLGARFERVALALDREAERASLALRAALTALRPALLSLPSPGARGAWVDPLRTKDPGDLTRAGVEALLGLR